MLVHVWDFENCFFFRLGGCKWFQRKFRCAYGSRIRCKTTHKIFRSDLRPLRTFYANHSIEFASMHMHPDGKHQALSDSMVFEHQQFRMNNSRTFLFSDFRRQSWFSDRRWTSWRHSMYSLASHKGIINSDFRSDYLCHFWRQEKWCNGNDWTILGQVADPW